MSIQIIGTGSYIPERIVTNDELSALVETNDEWIQQRVGIAERHVSVNETAADMAIQAANRALEAAGCSGGDIDLIIAATMSSDTACPTVASTVQAAIGASCPAFDINSCCSGFLFGLDIAISYMQRGGMQRILVLGAERMSKIIDWSDRSTCVIFGDGAGAAVLAPGKEPVVSRIYTCGDRDVIYVPTHSGASPFFEKEKEPPFVNMNGQETFKFAVNRMTEDMRYAVEQYGVSLEDIAWFVPHQANRRIIDFASKRLGVPKEKFFVNIDTVGNTSAASVPIALDALLRSGKAKHGDLIAMSAFGGGLSSAVCIIKY